MTETYVKICGLLLALMMGFAAPGQAGVSVLANGFATVPSDTPALMQLADDGEDGSNGGGANLPVQPSEAASIAKSLVPGARVLKVNLLPSGVYAVTLRGDGKLTRVMVDGHTGAAN